MANPAKAMNNTTTELYDPLPEAPPAGAQHAEALRAVYRLAGLDPRSARRAAEADMEDLFGPGQAAA